MSRYNRLPPRELESKQEAKRSIPISPLCSLPIFMANNPGYKSQLSQFMSLEELMPKTQRLQIYQMMYMDKLLEQLREYQPDMEDVDPFDVMSKASGEEQAPKETEMLKSIMKYQSTKDPASLMGAMMPGNPMMSMLLPMMTGGMGGGSGNGGDMLSSLLPMMMGGMGGGGGGDMMSSLLPMMMGGMGGGGGGDMMSSLLPMMMGGMGGGGGGGNSDMLSSLLGKM